MASSDWDEKSGIGLNELAVSTPWGCWRQTLDDIQIEINLPFGTRSANVQCTIKADSLKIVVQQKTIIEGEFLKKVHANEATWTIEDKKLLRILIPKGSNDWKDNAWHSLLRDQFEADAITRDRIERSLTLQRFQRENPGFDFSSAEISGNYAGGGPNIPEHH